jgi:hypothetical protein
MAQHFGGCEAFLRNVREKNEGQGSPSNGKHNAFQKFGVPFSGLK